MEKKKKREGTRPPGENGYEKLDNLSFIKKANREGGEVSGKKGEENSKLTWKKPSSSYIV